MEFEFTNGSSDFGVDYSKLNTPKSKRGSATPKNGDRFIPNRSAMDLEIASFNLSKENCNPNDNVLFGT